MSDGRVVVGVDGSPASRAALRWAAGEARRRCVALHVLHVRPAADPRDLSARLAAELAASRQRHADSLLASARAELAGTGLTVPMRTEVRTGGAGEEIIRYAEGAQLLVVGRRRPETAESVLGSVSHRVASFARCPVAVVPVGGDRPARSGVPVVAVGVSRSAGAARALDAAFAHAQRIGGEVHAVRAWGTLDWAGRMSLFTPDSAERWRLASQHLLDDAVARGRRDYPAVPVRTDLVRGPVLAALLSAATGADLLLLEGRLRGDARSSQLGWTATSLLADAPCPVEVVGLPVPDPSVARPPVRTLPVAPPRALAGVR